MRDIIGVTLTTTLAALLIVGVTCAIAFGIVMLCALGGVEIPFMLGVFIAAVLIVIFALTAEDKEGDDIGGN